jgi:hypothetical protein
MRLSRGARVKQQDRSASIDTSVASSERSHVGTAQHRHGGKVEAVAGFAGWQASLKQMSLDTLLTAFGKFQFGEGGQPVANMDVPRASGGSHGPIFRQTDRQHGDCEWRLVTRPMPLLAIQRAAARCMNSVLAAAMSWGWCGRNFMNNLRLWLVTCHPANSVSRHGC